MRPRTGNTIGLFATALLTSLSVSSAYGGVAEFTDKDAWIAAVGQFTTIDFTGFPVGTFITDQYADLGVLFTDGSDSIVAIGAFPDGFGLDGNPSMHLSFDSPQLWLAVDHPGSVQIDLFSGGNLFHSAVFFHAGHGFFSGVLSAELFDSVVISDPAVGDVFIDDLHFGVPSRGVIAFLALGGLHHRRRRDSCSRRVG